jgi:ribosomal protein S18 acetylase RimI-like enzyme
MTLAPKQGLFKKNTLTDAELTEIQKLASICENHDRIDLRLNWDSLKWRTGEKANDFTYYRDDVLVGFLALDGLGFQDAEGTGMVHPDYRRQGIFRALVAAAQEECRANGTEALILVADRRSHAAMAFATTIGAQRDFSEHRMRISADRAIPHVERRLAFRPATPDDASAIAGMLAEDFGMGAEHLRHNIVRNMRSASYQYYIAALDGEPVGTLNVQEIGGDAYIYGFVVRPEYRGRGYGKEMLARAIEHILGARPQPIYLEVETENDPAFGLYRSFGFELVTTYDYYRISASKEMI